MSKNRWARPSSSKKSRHGMVFEELEPRLLLSADLPLDLPAAFAPDSDDDSVPATVEVVESVTTPEEHTPRELVFVDTDTPDYELLLDDLLSNNETRQIEVVVLDNNSDGIAQISSALSQYRGLDAVHIISHGSEGSVDLGGSRLEFDTLLTNATAIKGWANAFSETGDLLIYGCNLAASADGQSLVDALGRLTGTDVAASDDLTGSAALGGDWDLEYRTGTIDTPAVVSSALQQQWNGLLEERTLLISTDSNVAAPGADGLSSGWTEGQVLNLGGPDLAHGVTTDGDLSIVIDFDNFTLDPVDTGALHFVSRDITVGGVNGTFDLKAGDVLVSFLQDETIVATYTNTGLNETYGDQDLLVFRPDSFGNYSSGTFYLLLDEVVADDLKGVTLVEQETSIGGAEVSAGSFLLIRESSATTSVDLFVPTGVGAGTTTGPVTPFIDLSTLGIDSNRLRGIELIEAATTVGGHGLAAGSLLATLNIDDNVTGVAGNNLLVDLNDVFVLNLSSIGPGNTSGTAAIFLDGSLVGLDDNPTQENPYALALYNYSQLVVDTASDVSDGDTSSITALMLDKGADGSISLREAIEATNATPNGDIADVIHFDIAGAHTIDVGNVADGNNGELPGITDAVIIDGTTDPDYAGTPIIVLDGSGAGAVDGLTLAAGSDGSTIRGLAINDFQGNGILVTGSSGNMMAGNHIGTDSTGMVDQGNGVTGIFVTNGAGNNTIGGLNAGDRNVVTGNSDDNIKIEATAGTGNTVIGNYIGVDAAGTSTLGNGGSGLDVQADGNTIGGATAEARNVISGSTFNGVAVSGDNNVIQGNFIGTDHTGTLDFGNGRNGVWISGGSNNLVGGAEAGAGNLIHGNSRNGVLVSNGAPTGNTILGNTIYGNDWIGIDLSTTTNGDGVTGNDDNDEDNGQPNELQNYPAITFAELDGTDLTLNGSLDTDGTGTQYHIEFFGNAAGTEDATNGEARVYLGTVTVTTDGSGDASFSGVTLAGVTLSAGDYVTATATRIEDPGQVGVDDQIAYGSTSEFAANLAITAVNAPPIAVADSFTVNEGSSTNLNLASNDTDADDGLDLTSITIVSGPTNGTIDSINVDGTVDYTHDGSETVADSFTYTIDDLATATSNTVTVSLTITPQNDAPVAVVDSFTVSEGSTTNLDLAVNDTDADDGLDLTSITIVSGPTSGTIDSINVDGTVDYTHDGSETVADSFTYTIDDLAAATSNTVTVSLTITPVNDPPVAVVDSFTVNEGSTTNLNLAANDSDADDGLDLTSITIVSGPTNGTIDSINVDGTVDYTHDGSETVADSFTYTIDDLAGATSNTVTVTLTITPTNDAPVATADSFTVNEGSTTNLNLAANDTDADDGLDSASITIVGGPTNGSIVVNANGTVDYTHDGSETLADSFTYTIDDLAGATSNTVTVSLTITPVNDAPIATADSFTVNQGSTTNLNLAVNDTDADDGLDLTSITIVFGPTNGSVVVNTDGTVDYTHDGSATVADSFTYIIDDASGAPSNTVTVGLTITLGNAAPVATADSFTVNEGSTTNLNLAANDTDADDGLDLASITIVGGPTNGSIVVNANGTVDYTHDGSETIADSFTYTIDDLAGATSNTVTVSLTVTPVNDTPVATADSFTVNQGSTTNLNLAANDTDADDGLDLTSISIVSGPANGTVVVNTDGTVDYTHDGSATVADSFTYTIDDASGLTSNTVTVGLTITLGNAAPVATADSFTVNEGSTTNLNLAGNDTDADDGLDLASITVVSGPSNGSVSVNANGTVDYTHDGSETVADSFTYTIDDLAGATSNTVTVSLTITPVNDTPVATADSFTVNQGSTTNLNLAVNDTDADDGLDLTSIAIVSGPANGSILVNTDGTVDYTHDGSATVADSFTYTIDDLTGASSNTVTVGLTITLGNAAPIATADSFTVNEGSTTNLNLAANDTDADDGLDLTSIAIVSGPTNGTVVVNTDGTVDYTHDGSATVADSFTYTIDDLTGASSNTVTVGLTITLGNAAPVATADSFTVNEGSTTNLNLAGNDTDADDGLDLASITIVGGPTNGAIVVNANGTVDYTHDGSETVADSFTYTIDDLAGATSNTVTVSLTVTPVNDAPIATADSFAVNQGSTTNLNLAVNDTDADDGLDLTSISIVSGPANGTVVVNTDGTVDYTHDGSATVADSFTYTIDDLSGATSNTVTVGLTITLGNAAPVATADSFTVNEGSTTNLNLAGNDTDADDGLDLASITVVSGPSNGSVSVNANGTVNYTHDGSETVADSFTYTIDDLAGATSNTVTVSLTVTPVNDAPIATADSFAVNQGSTTNLNLAVNDTDADDGLDLTSISIVSGPANGTIVVNTDGTVDYTHDGSATVGDSLTYTIDDLTGASSNTVTVGLTITLGNAAPVATADSFTVDEGSTTNLNLAANDTDADDRLDLTSIAIVGGPTNGSIVVNANGTVDYTHDGSETLADSFTYTIDDLAGATSNTVTVSLTITPVNDAPVATADSFTVNEGSTTNLNLAANDTDADDGLDLTSITIVSGPTNGSIVVNTDGTVDYTHDGSATVADSFTYAIDDITGDTSDTVLVNLSIDPINEAPTQNVPTDQSTPVNTPLVFSSENGNSITVGHPDGSDAIMEVTLSTSNGTLSLTGTAGLSFDAGDGSGDTTMKFTGTASDINNALEGLTFQPDEDYEGAATVQIVTDDLGTSATGGPFNAIDSVGIAVTANAQDGMSLDALPPLDELIENTLDLPAGGSVPAPVDDANADLAAVGTKNTVTARSEPPTTSLADASDGTTRRLGGGVPTQIELSLPSSTALANLNFQIGDDNGPTAVQLVRYAIQQALADPLVFAKTLLPLEPDISVWEAIDAMMDQMDGDDESWYGDDQVLTTTTTTGLTVSFTVGYVSWLLRAGYLSASFMSILPLWSEFDPLPILGKTKNKKRDSDARDKDSTKNNDTVSEEIFASHPFPESRTISSETIR